MSYIAEDSFIDDTLVPYDWYKELVLVGARTHGFPTTYIDEIVAVTGHQDPDPGRRAES